ncbi:hypothetical protein YC2023_107183 [Brassica napus]
MPKEEEGDEQPCSCGESWILAQFDLSSSALSPDQYYHQPYPSPRKVGPLHRTASFQSPRASVSFAGPRQEEEDRDDVYKDDKRFVHTEVAYSKKENNGLKIRLHGCFFEDHPMIKCIQRRDLSNIIVDKEKMHIQDINTLGLAQPDL